MKARGVSVSSLDDPGSRVGVEGGLCGVIFWEIPSPKSLLVETSRGREEGREVGEVGLACNMLLFVGVL